MNDIALIANQPKLTPQEYKRIAEYMFTTTGVDLGDTKQMLVSSRLGKRLRKLKLKSFGEYLDIVLTQPAEREVAIDLLTTHETYFFREPEHFRFLREQVLPKHNGGRTFRVWSAASSTGEEMYSIAMTLADHFRFNSQWMIMGSDVSKPCLETARQGIYPMQRIDGISKNHLKQYCLKGKGEYQGQLMVDSSLRDRIELMHINLMEDLPDLEPFDVVFLRNVLIYFDDPTKEKIVNRLAQRMRRGGYLMIGHSESLKTLKTTLDTAAPTVYQRP